jgi:hypothetical protein
LYVTHQEVVRLARFFSQRPGPLPPAPAQPPSNVLVSQVLLALGITLGGIPALETTIQELLQAAELFNMRKKSNP